MFKLPFGWLPAHWGSAGKTREIAKAEYELIGFDLEKKLLEINEDEYDISSNTKKMLKLYLKYERITTEQFDRGIASTIQDSKIQARTVLDLDLKYGRITREQFDRLMIELIEDPKTKALATLELDRREAKIGDLEYSKKLATLNNEPWVTVLNMDFGGKTALEGSFELDWNEQFVAKLEKEGYQGPTPDSIVNAWFMEVCRNVAMEEFDGTGDFTADSQANLDTMKRWGSEKLSENRKLHK